MDFARQIKLVGIAQIFFAGMRLVGSLLFGLLFSSIASVAPPGSNPMFILGLMACCRLWRRASDY